MITKQQALTEVEFHLGTCSYVTTIHGVKYLSRNTYFRTLTKAQTWVRRPDDFVIGVSIYAHSRRAHQYIVWHKGVGSFLNNSHLWHTASDCHPSNVDMRERAQELLAGVLT